VVVQYGRDPSRTDVYKFGIPIIRLKMRLWALKKTTEACVWTKSILKDSYSIGKANMNIQSG